MTYTHMTRLVATAAGLLGSAAFVALASLPGVAQSTVNSQESNSETRTYPGPSETPSGSPSVPGTSTYDDPGITQESQPDQEARRDTDSAPQPTIELYERGRDGIVDPAEIPADSEQEPYNNDINSSLPASENLVAQASTRGERVEDGPSAVEEGVPGPSETPSGSPSVPGVSEADDPGLQDETEGSMSRPATPERDALNSPNQPDGPSAVEEGVPGPSETPSGSPSVPGVSVYDDPNEETDGLTSPGQGSMDDRREGPSAVEEGVPGAGETPSGSPSVPGTSGVDDPGMKK